MDFDTEEKSLLAVKNLEQVKTFCLNSLKLKSEGNSMQYDHIVAQARSQDDPETLAAVLVALSSYISVILSSTNDYLDLIHAILSYSWQSEKRVSIATMYFISHLISSDVTFAIPVFEKLVSNFCHFDGSSTHSEDKMHTALIHRTIRGIFALAPVSQQYLFPILAKQFPHKRFSIAIQTFFVGQLLNICSYASTIQQNILDLIVSKCLEIDVEIVIEDSGDVKLNTDDRLVDEENMFQLELEENHNHSTSKSESQNANQQRIPDEVIESAEKLDAMLVLIVDYIDMVFAGAKSSNNNRLKDNLTNQLFVIFEERILSTHKSKFAQFLIFYLCSKDEAIATALSQRLFKIFTDSGKGVSAIKRQSAIMYLASYLSRAKYLSISYVSDILNDIVTWCGAYVDSYQHKQETEAKQHLNQNRSVPFQSMKFNHSSSNASVVSVGSDRTTNASEDNNSHSTEILSNYTYRPVTFTGTNHQNSSSNMLLAQEIYLHETFYCAVEAACYILCYFGPEMAQMHRENEYLHQDWQRIVSCPLQPLRYCLQTVRYEFLKLSLHVHMLEEEFWNQLSPDVLYDQSRHRLHDMNSTSSASNSNNNNHNNNNNNNNYSGCNPLDSFFPFDPCLLRMLQYRIEGFYRVWVSFTLENDVSEDSMSEKNMVISSSYASVVSSMAHTYGTDMAISLVDYQLTGINGINNNNNNNNNNSHNNTFNSNNNTNNTNSTSSSIPAESFIRLLHRHRSASLGSDGSELSLTLNNSGIGTINNVVHGSNSSQGSGNYSNHNYNSNSSNNNYNSQSDVLLKPLVEFSGDENETVQRRPRLYSVSSTGSF